jgi:hypothetical protein
MHSGGFETELARRVLLSFWRKVCSSQTPKRPQTEHVRTTGCMHSGGFTGIQMHENLGTCDAIRYPIPAEKP